MTWRGIKQPPPTPEPEKVFIGVNDKRMQQDAHDKVDTTPGLAPTLLAKFGAQSWLKKFLDSCGGRDKQLI